ncbi:MAG: histidine phosphatase family protein [Anaerolineae bacterium]|jgi:broad specificity phosphatase PhoE|nr:histidine phosphatase family protein [Anaerolineae bacterium]
MSSKRVIFIRPGETRWNRLGRWQGQVAIPLNDHGRQQCERLAQFVRPIGIQALYTSDLRRAQETAHILAARLPIQPVADARLRERHIGIWQGLTQQEVMEWYSDEYQALLASPDDYIIPGGESRRVVAARMKAAFDALVAGAAENTIGLVTHTTAIRALLGVLLPELDALSMEFNNMSVTSLVATADGWKLTQRNDVTHLEGMPSTDFPEMEKQA